MEENLLEVKNLKTHFDTRDGKVPAVDGVSFDLRRGETLGLVGESGCGKSITCLSILRLIDPPGKIIGGQIRFHGQNLLDLDDRQMRSIRGNRIAMIFQEPMTSLNPVLTLGRQLTESLTFHRSLSRKEAREVAAESLHRVGIPQAQKRLSAFPHQLSGGQRQRAMIAMALLCHPDLLIADEPTTALDVTIQAQILALLQDLRQSLGMSILIITHSLGVISEMAERVIVMYAGKIVEEADRKSLFKDPLHPYTQGLLTSIPRISDKQKELSVIRGVVPRPTDFPAGCRFHPRCDHCRPICCWREPDLRAAKSGRTVRCWIGTPAYAESKGSS